MSNDVLPETRPGEALWGKALVADYVGRRAARLYQGYHADTAAAVAELAQLRRCLPSQGRLPPESWAMFSAEDFPISLLGDDDQPSAGELAVVSGLALFALHQQSRRDEPMHKAGASYAFGRAVAVLADRTGGGAVEARFHVLQRVTEVHAALYHLRGMVSQLRAERIPLDHGTLAGDIYDLQLGGGPQRVCIRWTRAFRRADLRTTSTETETDLSPVGDDQ